MTTSRSKAYRPQTNLMAASPPVPWGVSTDGESWAAVTVGSVDEALTTGRTQRMTIYQ